jgi:hypothetical protein
MFRDEAMSRRSCPVTRVKKGSETTWNHYWNLLRESKDFIRSYHKCMKEDFSKDYNCAAYDPYSDEYALNASTQSKLFYEIKGMINEDSSRLWYNWLKDNVTELLSDSGRKLKGGFSNLAILADKDKRKAVERDALHKNYLQRCRDIGINKPFAYVAFRDKLKTLGFGDETRNQVRCTNLTEGGTARIRLMYIPKDLLDAALFEQIRINGEERKENQEHAKRATAEMSLRTESINTPAPVIPTKNECLQVINSVTPAINEEEVGSEFCLK